MLKGMKICGLTDRDDSAVGRNVLRKRIVRGSAMESDGNRELAGGRCCKSGACEKSHGGSNGGELHSGREIRLFRDWEIKSNETGLRMIQWVEGDAAEE